MGLWSRSAWNTWRGTRTRPSYPRPRCRTRRRLNWRSIGRLAEIERTCDLHRSRGECSLNVLIALAGWRGLASCRRSTLSHLSRRKACRGAGQPCGPRARLAGSEAVIPCGKMTPRRWRTSLRGLRPRCASARSATDRQYLCKSAGLGTTASGNSCRMFSLGTGNPHGGRGARAGTERITDDLATAGSARLVFTVTGASSTSDRNTRSRRAVLLSRPCIGPRPARMEAGLAGIGRITLSRRERMALVEPRGTDLSPH